MGPCPICGGTIGYAGTQCRNRIAMPTCDECGAVLDRTYCPSYAYVHAQSERRKRKWSPAKELLRKSECTSREFIRSRCWTMYMIDDLIEIRYNSANDTYDIVVPGETDVIGIGIDGLIEWVAESGLTDNRDLQFSG
ncbi:hypothetical protein Rcae01_06795 [Novipirellula caenicola]|uniref:Uncharacterized protein n=2 Tax=Novipirellula caenicola TaxID=1536901 RepID=A0ABP9W1M3_9BACT